MKINTAKLNAIREAHERRRDAYAGVSARARAAKVEAQELRSFNPAMTATPAQREMIARVLAFAPADLLALPAEVLTTIGLTPDMINAGLEAQRRADALQIEADAMLVQLHASGAILSRLNAYAKGLQ
jgi:hypothetical protein